MRAFSFHRERAAFAALLFIASVGLPRPAAGQWPGELRVQLVDAANGSAIAGAEVSLTGETGATRAARSDVTGAAYLRGLEPGGYRLRVHRVGYGDAAREVDVHNGAVTRLRLALDPAALVIEGVDAVVQRTATLGARVVGRAEIAGSGARTAGDVVSLVPGTVVRRDAPGGAETVSIRGSAPDAVLVLVDGVPLNDPLTGEADLAVLAASGIESVTVLPGAHSARYGARAEAGVVLVQTLAAPPGVEATGRFGSLGAREGGASLGGSMAGWALDAGGAARSLDGAFDFSLPAEVGGGAARRANADAEHRDLHAGASRSVAQGLLRTRVSSERLRRGIPGKGFDPSPEAREHLQRLTGSVGWERERGPASIRVEGYATRQELRFRDPAPPFGLPYDDRTRHFEGAAKLHLAVERDGRFLESLEVGAEATHQRVRSDALDGGRPPTRTDLALGGEATASAEVAGRPVDLSLAVRVQHDGLDDARHVTHEAAASIPFGSVRLRLAHRSGYSPPTLADQFFREGVGVAPNPDLGAERVPSEFDAAFAATFTKGSLHAAAGAEAYVGDVDGMIVWSPDFRFVWSPRNVDVLRRGAELWGELRMPSHGLRLNGSYSYVRVTYDRGPADHDAQVAYRPRNGALFRARLDRRPASVEVSARYTGVRQTVAREVNPLPGFWTAGVNVTLPFDLAAWRIRPRATVDRLFDARDVLIFGFPDPGRVFSLDVSIGRSGRP